MNTETLYLIIVYAFVFIFGICIGSFLNVCIYRLPLGESLIKSNSHCMTCGTPIRKRDLIPVVSWCLLRGKCHACGARISPRYTVVELLNGICYLIIFLHFDVVSHPLYASIVALMTSALIVVFFMDWDTQLINTWVVIFIGALSIPKYIFCRQECNYTLTKMIVGALVISIPLLVISLASHEKAMGMGDVYLMAAAGLFLGTPNVVIAMLIALITGSVCGLIIKHSNGSSVFAFGPYLAIGIAVAALYGDQIADFYVKFTGLDETLSEAAMVIAKVL
ncbi:MULTISPECIES: prepilin peptidase [Ruminococcus]|uniref:Prepilin peptidase n=1 Tax=Ruminococcus albus (strain ATCC 27210 / DSM 20455 / JCM 14654 / NCDO 2250 / 7) TaxID=697329 RepID=E6UE07_RUMA7|nr:MULTISPECIES: A24 family peptidase [Ruminococcus]ADU22872.1 Prepilin peptidase [Ruminococcus albus 7 = DSM 20455]MCR5019633.1 prepilin peptidase [Ruminococcus sp.]